MGLAFISQPQLLLAKVCTTRFQSPLTKGLEVRYRNKKLSWGLRGILRAGNTLTKGCGWKVGNGKSIIAGKDRWMVGRVPEYKSTVTLHQATGWKASLFICPSGSEWNLARLNSAFVQADASVIAKGLRQQDLFVAKNAGGLRTLHPPELIRDGLVSRIWEYGEKGWLGGASSGLAQSTLHAELNACLAGLQWAITRSLRAVIIYRLHCCSSLPS
uniref:Uncharacterized protein n=1 Tax=Chenopodium quinoa TaxID=63459 RepID=A0A803LVM2_CHEQI